MPWSKELQDSWKAQQKIKNDQKDCTVCGCPITKKEYDDYKMCPWCYAESVFDNEGGIPS